MGGNQALHVWETIGEEWALRHRLIGEARTRFDCLFTCDEMRKEIVCGGREEEILESVKLSDRISRPCSTAVDLVLVGYDGNRRLLECLVVSGS